MKNKKTVEHPSPFYLVFNGRSETAGCLLGDGALPAQWLNALVEISCFFIQLLLFFFFTRTLFNILFSYTGIVLKNSIHVRHNLSPTALARMCSTTRALRTTTPRLREEEEKNLNRNSDKIIMLGLVIRLVSTDEIIILKKKNCLKQRYLYDILNDIVMRFPSIHVDIPLV